MHAIIRCIQSVITLSVGNTAILGPYPIVGVDWPLRDLEILESISLVRDEYLIRLATDMGIRIREHARRFIRKNWICRKAPDSVSLRMLWILVADV